MRRGPSPSMLFDAGGRLLVHDMQSLRIYAAGPTSRRKPASRSNRSPADAGFRARSFYRDGQDDRRTDRRSPALIGRLPLAILSPPKSSSRWSSPLATRCDPDPTGPAVGRRQAQGGIEFSGPLFRAIQISPSGDRLYTIEQKMGSPGVLRVWAIEMAAGSSSARAREIESIPHSDSTSFSSSDGVTNMALRGDGKTLAVAERSGQVTLLDASNLAVLSVLTEPGKDEDNPMRTLAFSPDGRELAVGSQQGTISLWSLAQPARPQIRMHLPGHRGWVTNLVYDLHGPPAGLLQLRSDDRSQRRSLGP